MDIIKDIDGTVITIAVNGVEKAFDISKLFAVDENDLVKEFSRQAAVYAYFGVAAAEAEHNAARCDFNVDQEYAQADAAARDELDKDGRKYTEAVVKGMVLTDAQYVEIVERALLAKYDHKVLKAITAAMEQRANMLISMGAFIRHEIDQTGMNIRERSLDKAVDDVKETLKARKAKRIS